MPTLVDCHIDQVRGVRRRGRSIVCVYCPRPSGCRMVSPGKMLGQNTYICLTVVFERTSSDTPVRVRAGLVNVSCTGCFIYLIIYLPRGRPAKPRVQTSRLVAVLTGKFVFTHGFTPPQPSPPVYGLARRLVVT